MASWVRRGIGVAGKDARRRRSRSCGKEEAPSSGVEPGEARRIISATDH